MRGFRLAFGESAKEVLDMKRVSKIVDRMKWMATYIHRVRIGGRRSGQRWGIYCCLVLGQFLYTTK